MLAFSRLSGESVTKFWEPKMTIVAVRQGSDGRKAILWLRDLNQNDLKSVV